ncbi:anaerobic ribonucleoside-triphosphate reductase [Jonesiaceae bacterium BS-20]|uniref:Anaerobic ribonucleoside-triphosphate reductase n=1 Tax=Jonesiaceae bacterium BS-20 TaxID=3120821 RepID=A0AAU7DSQ8_9MICO
MSTPIELFNVSMSAFSNRHAGHAEHRDQLARLLVQKRDGRKLQFDETRIRAALAKAFAEVYGDLEVRHADAINQLTDAILCDIATKFAAVVEIHDIQATVEHALLQSGNSTVAEAYIEYRVQRDLMRSRAIDVNASIGKLVNKDSSIIHENANKDANVFNTQRDLTAGAVSKAVGLTMLPPHVANAHAKGDLHYHDLDYHPYAPMTNCLVIDFPTMLSQGFRIGNAEVGPPQSIQTATAQISQIIANVASSQYGGCSVNRIDELLVPYAKLNYAKHVARAQDWIDGEERRKDYALACTRKDIYDAMQSLEYEINTLFTSNGQTPFTSIGFGLGQDWFAREIQRSILEIRLKGLGKERRTAIFPKLIFTLRRGVNLETADPNYDIKELAVQCATKRMYPDILSYDKIVELTGSFKAPMGCRSFLQGWKDEDGNDVVEGRMNLGVVTLNIPRIAMQTDSEAEFFELLNQRLDIMHDALLYRVERCKEAMPANAPILYVHGAFGQRLEIDDPVDAVFRNRRATVSLGYIGLYEAATAFYGGQWETNSQAKEFTLRVLQTLNEAARQWSDDHGYHFSVYSTPSESLTDRFARMDLEKFGAVTDITDKGYYTNSFHYDVRKSPTPFEKLDFEAEYAPLTSGGFIHYCEYPVLQQNPKALEAVWDYAYDRVGYLGTNTPIDHCLECEFRGDFTPTERGFMCPSCGNDDPSTCDVVKRTCGYLGNPVQRPWIKGRLAEVSARVKHMPGATGNMPELQGEQ